MVNPHRSAIRRNTSQHSIAIFARLCCDMGSQNRHARLDAPDMQVMHLCHTIHLPNSNNVSLQIYVLHMSERQYKAIMT